jgi:twitching motility two-component system response regulator PilG
MDSSPRIRSEGAGETELTAALAAARRGDRERAQELAWQSLRQNPRRESSWLLLASLVVSREDQEMCLRQVLSIDPQHAFAMRWFERVMSAENPDALPLPYVNEAAVPPPPARSVAPSADRPMARIVPFDTMPLSVHRLSGQPPEAVAIRPRVLVVDDSATVRRLVSIALEQLGCDVVTASGGLEALGAMSHAAPSLVLLDVGLPNLDGHQICRAIRRNERTRHVPVVMLTGRDGLVDRLRGKIAGASEYLTKPFDPKLLAEVVGRYLTLNGGDGWQAR